MRDKVSRSNGCKFCWTHTLKHTPTYPPTHTHTFTHTHTKTHTHAQALTHPKMYTHTQAVETLSLSHTHTLTDTDSLTYTWTTFHCSSLLPLSRFLTALFSVCHTHTHTRTNTHSHPHTRTHTHTHSQTLSHAHHTKLKINRKMLRKKTQDVDFEIVSKSLTGNSWNCGHGFESRYCSLLSWCPKFVEQHLCNK